ncbi:hypothetical protein [Marixanthomonas spongiae]|uniref:hypothetical protein n=1 Tax=Marixanthomonas spongiae TaxID=2174845 RepID=UPI001F0CA1F5|nr:hypothetical protein [Marixanthomonas spongiae]
MKSKTYIAALLACIFLAKFLAIDANGLNVLFSESNITFVNPHCKTKNPPTESNKTADFLKADLSAPQFMALNGFCASQFQLQLFTWNVHISEPIAVFDEHFSSRLRYLYLDNASPPPRLA